MSAPGRVKGLDGKLYRSTPLTLAERARAIRLAHQLVHSEGLSIRAAQEVMLRSYALRRSTGAIRRDLDGYVCQHCDDQ